MADLQNLGEWLRARMTKGRKSPMTYRQVSEYADIAPVTVKRILDGEKVNADTVLKLANWSNEPFEALLELASHQPGIGGEEDNREEEEDDGPVVYMLNRDEHISESARRRLIEIYKRERRAYEEGK